jgi:hypothetical protein
MEAPFNLDPNFKTPAAVWVIENWARNKNILGELNKENIDLLLNATNELLAQPDIEGLEWVIDGWKKYFDQVKNDLIIINDDDSDSTIKSGNDENDEINNLKSLKRTKKLIKKKTKKPVIVTCLYNLFFIFLSDLYFILF